MVNVLSRDTSCDFALGSSARSEGTGLANALSKI